MFIGVLEIKIYIPMSQSLKDKRRVMKSIITRLQNKYNASVIEAKEQDRRKVGLIGLAIVSSNSKLLNRQLSMIVNYVEDETDFEIIRIKREII